MSYITVFLPTKLLVDNLNNIKKLITADDWSLAKKNLSNLEKNWDNRLVIQLSNETAEIYEFERTLGQLRTLIKHKEDDSLEHLGLLKVISQNLTDVFPRP
jgi:uncharacterized protein YjiK